jgi:multisubunit Na+/H+ antiporter MnhC subunit
MASTLGIVFSMLVMFFEVAQLLIYFLCAPQAGIPVVQTTGGPASWVSAADILSLMALILTMVVEVTVLAFSLWLLLRTMKASMEYPHISDEAS